MKNFIISSFYLIVSMIITGFALVTFPFWAPVMGVWVLMDEFK